MTSAILFSLVEIVPAGTYNCEKKYQHPRIRYVRVSWGCGGNDFACN